jgi:hypothetical protein
MTCHFVRQLDSECFIKVEYVPCQYFDGQTPRVFVTENMAVYFWARGCAAQPGRCGSSSRSVENLGRLAYYSANAESGAGRKTTLVSVAKRLKVERALRARLANARRGTAVPRPRSTCAITREARNGTCFATETTLGSLVGDEVYKSIKFLFSLAPKTPRKGRGSQRVRRVDE